LRKHKIKGDKYERELGKYFNEVLGIETAHRAPLSGGGFVGNMVGGADVIGVPDLFIEAKRVERLNFMDAVRQAEGNREKTNSPEVPIVINRRNQMTTGQSLCVLRLDDFMKFYKVYLQTTGVKGRPQR
jgi:hypothetical protein|tara:strand:- start:4507 stop:4893 length:387 start_codon:yes stop_codon:yes gene_type:complete